MTALPVSPIRNILLDAVVSDELISYVKIAQENGVSKQFVHLLAEKLGLIQDIKKHNKEIRKERKANYCIVCGERLGSRPMASRSVCSAACKVISTVEVNKETGCHETTLGRNAVTGYARVRFAGEVKGAHRVMYEAVYGEIPEGSVVMHTCDNPKCVNPDHLTVGTQIENVQDRDAKGRTKNNKDSIFTKYDIRSIRASDCSLDSLAFVYGVHTKTINNIRTRKTFKNVSDSDEVCLTSAAQ